MYLTLWSIDKLLGNCETNNRKRCIDHEKRMYYKNLQFGTITSNLGAL